VTDPPKKPSGLRTLGGPSKPAADAPKRSKADDALAARAVEVLKAEFEKALALKEKLAGEAVESSEQKGRDPRQAEKLRSLVASLEGMSRFAIAMGLLTPAENRAIWSEYMARGLYEGWR
jgi:hypothetical protein